MAEKMTMSALKRKRGFLIRAVSLVAVAFGLLTIKEGGTILFGNEAARAAAGSYVPFVLWFNFLAGFVYVIAGAGLWARRRWAAWLSLLLAAATAAVFAAFGTYVAFGGAYELRTVIAMALRTLVWVTIAWASYRSILRAAQSTVSD